VPEKHEKSKGHMETMSKWLELEQRLLEGKATDYENQLRIQEVKTNWQDLLERLISITQCLASHNLAFGGHRETLSLDSPQNSGNLIDLVKLLLIYEPVL
jgi:hypothetical protein